MKIRPRKHKSGRVTYQLDLGEIEGKRKQISFKTKQEASNALDAKREQLRRHGTAALTFSEADRHRFAVAQERLVAADSTIEEAVEFFLRHSGKRKKVATIAQLLVAWRAAKSSDGKDPSYLSDVQRTATAFARSGHEATPVHLIPSEDIEGWLNGNGWAPKTRIVYLTDLTSLLGWGVKKGFLAVNPCTVIERPDLDERPPPIFTVNQCSALLEAALVTDAPGLDGIRPLGLLAYIAVCLLAGVRPEETQKLTWADVDLERRIIHISAVVAKRVRGPRRRIVNMSDQLAAWLGKVKNQTGPLPPIGLQKRRRHLCALAKIDVYPQDVLRHSFASYDLALYGSPEATAGKLGHRNSYMLFQHYREVVAPDEAKAFAALRPARDLSAARLRIIERERELKERAEKRKRETPSRRAPTGSTRE